MYTITCDGEILHDPRLGEGYVVIEPILTEDMETAGLLEFSVAPTNQCYEDIVELKNRIRVYRDDVCIWEGRTLNIEIPYNLIKRVKCEGRIAELRDCMFTTVIIRKYSNDRATETEIPGETIERADGNLPAAYQDFFDRFNSFIGDISKNVILGSMDIATKRGQSTGYADLKSFDPTATFYDLLYHGQENSEQDETSSGRWAFPPITEAPYNAHIIPRYRGEDPLIVDILENTSAEVSDQKIEFGKNLLDITQYIDPDGVFSIIYPIFKLTEESSGYYLDGTLNPLSDGTLTGKTLEDSDVVNLIGRVIRGVIIYYDYYSEIDTQEKRDALASATLQDAVNSSLTVEITAVDLAALGVDVDSIELFKYYEILSPPHNFDEIFQCTAIARDLDEPQNDTYTFGVARQTLTNWITQQISASKTSNYTVDDGDGETTNENATIRAAIDVAELAKTKDGGTEAGK